MEQQKDLHLQVSEDLKVPIIEERLQVGKRIKETGKVKITKTVVEEEVPYSIALLAESFTTETVTVN